MPVPSIYINLEDDVSKVVARIKKERSSELILVCPKRCFLFNDSINLRLLKKQADLLNKKVSVLTMDERGQIYAKEAGFELKSMPKAAGPAGFSDIARKQPIKTVGASAKPAEIPSVKIKTPEIQPEISSAEEIKQEPELLSQDTVYKHKLSEAVKLVDSSENIFPRELNAFHEARLRHKRQKWSLVIFSFAAILVTLTVVFGILPRAEVVVYPKTAALTRNLIISVSTVAKEIDSEALILPGQKITQKVSIQNSFQSQGKKEVGNKASGSAVIYNFTGAPLNLKAKTTVVTLNGKNYVLLSDAMQIRPTKYKNAATKEVDPSSLAAPIPIEATEGGESYNLPAGTRLEVSNQVFGSRPQVLYAKASVAITGGTSRYLSLVSAQDLASAKGELLKQAYQEQAAALDTKGYVLAQNAATFQNPVYEFDKQEGAESPQFNGKVTADLNGVAYSKQDLEKVVMDRIKNSLNSESKLDIKLTSPLTSNVKSADFNLGLVVLEVHFDGLAVAKNQGLDDISSKLIGKSQASAADYIKENAEVQKVEITLTPGWQKWLPLFKSSIKIIQNN